MAEIILKNDIATRILEQAQQYGYASPEAYLADLLDADAKQHEDGAYDPTLGEQFKTSFKQALRGEVMTKEELWRRLASDE